jgi:hypothetical protein
LLIAETSINGNNVTNAKCDERTGKHYGECTKQNKGSVVPKVHKDLYNRERENVGC